jgi:hypothetical protein
VGGWEWGSAAWAANFASFIGLAIAVASTLLPRPLLDIANVQEDVQAAITNLEEVWQDGLEYFCAGSVSTRAFVVESKEKALGETIAKTQGYLDSSWWEAPNLGRFGRRRALCQDFITVLHQLQRLTFGMRVSIIMEDFGENHQRFAACMKRPMEDLRSGAMELLALSAACCSSGRVEEEERRKLAQQCAEVRQKREATTHT